MAWIKFEKDLQTDPRVLKIARILSSRCHLFDNSDPALEPLDPRNAVALPAVTLVCGCLVRLWSLADTHVGDDDILQLPATEIDALLGVQGFCSLLPDDWIIDRGDFVELPEFHIHNGTLARKKAVTQKRVERHRKRNAPALPHVTHQALPDQTIPYHTIKREKEREKGAANRGTRLSIEVLPETWAEQCKAERPDLDPETSFKGFRDYWIAVPGSKGVKLDWEATWRNWIRREVAPKKPNGGVAAWWASNEGIQAKAAELGIEPRKGEGWNDLKARVNAQLGAH